MIRSELKHHDNDEIRHDEDIVVDGGGIIVQMQHVKAIEVG